MRGLQELLHAMVAGHESEPFVEALAVRASHIGGDLDQEAVPSTCAGDGVANEFGAKTFAPKVRPDPNALDLSSEPSGVAETSDEGQLVAADDGAVGFSDDDVVVGLVDEMREGITVRPGSVGKDRILVSAEFVVVQQVDDGGQVGPPAIRYAIVLDMPRRYGGLHHADSRQYGG